MRYSTITILFSALLAATALAHPSDNRRRNNIDVPEAHVTNTVDPIDRRDVKPTSTSSSAATTSTAAAEPKYVLYFHDITLRTYS